MDPYYSKRPKPRQRRNSAALFSLILLGCGIIFFAVVMMACAFVINYADDFETSDGTGVEEHVARGFTYCQYWAGVPFLVTGVLAIFSGVYQRSRGLSITTFLFAVICVALTLFIVALDGTNWSQWSRWQRQKVYWDDKDDVECDTVGESCVCTETSASFNGVRFSPPVSCDDLSELSSLYGAVVGTSIAVAVLCVFSIVVITKSLSWKPIRYSRGVYYADDFHVMPTRAPSVIDMPYAKREYLEPAPPAGPPYKQTVYRNYPY